MDSKDSQMKSAYTLTHNFLDPSYERRASFALLVSSKQFVQFQVPVKHFCAVVRCFRPLHNLQPGQSPLVGCLCVCAAILCIELLSYPNDDTLMRGNMKFTTWLERVDLDPIG